VFFLPCAPRTKEVPAPPVLRSTSCCAVGSWGGRRPSGGGHEWGDHRRRALMLAILARSTLPENT
jgi:hypothetical protein